MSEQEQSTDESSNACQSKCKKKTTTNPYPDEWKKVTEVKYCDPLILVRCKVRSKKWNGKEFIVGRAYLIKYKWEDNQSQVQGYCSVVVPCGMVTDLASIPRICRGAVSKVGLHVEASVVHDYLYGAQLEFGQGNRKEDRKFADELYKRLMEKAGVNRFKRWLIYRAVRTFGSSAFKKRNRYVGQCKETCCCNAPHKICCNNAAKPCPKTGEQAVTEK